jgi:hypothetical protein
MAAPDAATLTRMVQGWAAWCSEAVSSWLYERGLGVMELGMLIVVGLLGTLAVYSFARKQTEATRSVRRHKCQVCKGVFSVTGVGTEYARCPQCGYLRDVRIARRP